MYTSYNLPGRCGDCLGVVWEHCNVGFSGNWIPWGSHISVRFSPPALELIIEEPFNGTLSTVLNGGEPPVGM